PSPVASSTPQLPARLGYQWATKPIHPTSTSDFSTTNSGDPDGIRTRVTCVKGGCPRPLDDGVSWRVKVSNGFYRPIRALRRWQDRIITRTWRIRTNPRSNHCSTACYRTGGGGPSGDR